MSKWILISVCDRDIMTEVFDSMEAATAQRNKEMVEWAHLFPDIFNQHEEYEDSDCGFGKYDAWATDQCDFDWLIVEIPTGTVCNNDQEELSAPDLDGLFDLFTPGERKETA